MKKIIIYSILVFIIDFISKVIVSGNLVLNESLVIINNFFSLTYVKNYGAAFSILTNQRLFLIIVSVISIILILIYISKNKVNKKIEIIAYSLLLGGILGNLYDRIFNGYVIDFFDFTIFDYNFAIFNLADSFIVIAVILFIIDTFWGDGK